MYGEESKFQASSGWQWRFCKWHGIRNLSLQGDKMSADREGGDDFITFFTEFIQEKGFTLDQIFNCDETGLNFLLHPDSTLVTAFEKSADGRKKNKERVMHVLMPLEQLKCLCSLLVKPSTQGAFKESMWIYCQCNTLHRRMLG